MVWGLVDPNSFGDFFPYGDEVGWEELVGLEPDNIAHPDVLPAPGHKLLAHEDLGLSLVELRIRLVSFLCVRTSFRVS